MSYRISMTRAELEAAHRAGLVTVDGRLTYEGRNLVGEPRRVESRASFTDRWLALRGPMNPNPRPPGYKED